MNRYIARLNISDGPKGFFKNQIYTQNEWLSFQPYFEEVKSMFDEEDRNLYVTIIEGRRAKSKHVNNFVSIATPKQWQYLEFINRKKINTIIDGGVYSGLQIIGFLLFFKKKLTVYGFEPLYEPYSTSLYKRWLDYFNVKVFSIALCKHIGKVKFYKDGASSRIVKKWVFKNKPKYVLAIPIDKFCKINNIKVDYIKLDVEGSEYEVLEGAGQTLKKQRPQIAVSLYHNKWDLFRIPLLLKKILKNYYYKIAHYSPSYIETTLYAIPKEIFREKEMISYKMEGGLKLEQNYFTK